MAKKNKGEALPPGYLPINRKLFSHPFWTESRAFSKFEAWTDLLQSARFDERPGTFWTKSGTIQFHRGDLVASYRHLSRAWGWPLGKVARFLDLCEKDKMIARRIECGQTIITVVNYFLYNGGPGTQQGTLFPKVSGQTGTLTGTLTGTPKPALAADSIATPEHQPEHQPEQKRNSDGYNIKECKKESKKEEIQGRSILPVKVREPKIPTFDQVHQAFIRFGGTKDQADSFFAKYEAVGWYIGNTPITSWPSLISKFLMAWKQISDGAAPPEPNAAGFIKPKQVY
jgi:hypothetical protein